VTTLRVVNQATFQGTQYAALADSGSISPGDITPGAEGDVITTVSGVAVWAPSSSSGPAVSGAVPTAAGNLTLALLARGTISLAQEPAGSGNNGIVMWDNAARPGFYWTPDSNIYGNTANYNPSNAAVGGNPTIDFVELADENQGSIVVGRTEANLLNTVDNFLQYAQWTIGAAVLYTGAFDLDPVFADVDNPVIFTGVAATHGPVLCAGLVAGDLVFVLWYVDNGGVTRSVQSAGVSAALPHYVLAMFSGGVLSIQVDGGAVVTAGPFPLPTFATFQTTQIAVGGTTFSERAEWVGSFVEIDTWNRALTPEEAGLANTYYASLLT
jgi:hypothetical protein